MLSKARRECARKPSLSPDLRADLDAHWNRLKTPATPEQIELRIEALLAHYWTPNLTEDVRAVMTADWIRALVTAPLWALDVACHRWLTDRETARRKPLPADIKDKLPNLT